MAALCAFPDGAAASETAAKRPARLSVLAVCEWPQLSGEERRVMAELELALDGYDIIAVDGVQAGFCDLSQEEQVALIRETTRNAADTSPVLWLDCGVAPRAAARLLLLREGAPVIMSLEAASLEELALIVREMVVGDPQAAPGGRVAPGEDDPAARSEREAPARERPGVEVGVLVGQEGSSFMWGGGVAADVRFPQGFFGRMAVFGKVGPREEASEFLIVGHRVETRLEAGYLWEAGRLGIGPAVGLSAMWSSIDFAIGEGHHQRQSWWSVRFAFGPEARWALTDRLSVVLDLTVGFMPGKRFYRRVSGSTLLETPTMDMAGALGLAVGI
jgi:hypothetical protein